MDGGGEVATVWWSRSAAFRAYRDQAMSENDDNTDLETRPCAHCGRPVLQRASAGRPFRYCRDNDGECQRASRNIRMRHRSSPGLAGQVARTWEIVDRLDTLVGPLTEALHSERDDARQRAEESERQAAAAARHAEEAQAARDEARREATAAATLQERAEAERDTARDELAAARDDLVEVRRDRESTERDLAAALRDAQVTAERADELRREPPPPGRPPTPRWPGCATTSRRPSPNGTPRAVPGGTWTAPSRTAPIWNAAWPPPAATRRPHTPGSPSFPAR